MSGDANIRNATPNVVRSAIENHVTKRVGIHYRVVIRVSVFVGNLVRRSAVSVIPILLRTSTVGGINQMKGRMEQIIVHGSEFFSHGAYFVFYRYVLLEDCGHVIESTALDRYMKISQENCEIFTKVCPVCGVGIVATSRFKNIVKKTSEHILAVKKTVFGDSKLMLIETSQSLLNDFERLQADHMRIIRIKCEC